MIAKPDPEASAAHDLYAGRDEAQDEGE